MLNVFVSLFFTFGCFPVTQELPRDMRTALKKSLRLHVIFNRTGSLCIDGKRNFTGQTGLSKRCCPALAIQYAGSFRFLFRNNELVLLGKDGKPVADNGARPVPEHMSSSILLMGLNGDILDENEDF